MVDGHLLRVCKLSIRPEILGVVFGMLKHKIRRVSDFLDHIYMTCNFILLFSALAFSQNSIQNFFIILCERVFLQKKKKKRKSVFWTITMLLWQWSHISSELYFWRSVNKSTYSGQSSPFGVDNSSTLLLIYKFIICFRMEYSCIFFGPCSKTNFQNFELFHSRLERRPNKLTWQHRMTTE